MHHDTRWPKKLHSCILLVRVIKLVFDHFFANVGSTGPADSSRPLQTYVWGLKGLQGPSLINIFAI